MTDHTVIIGGLGWGAVSWRGVRRFGVGYRLDAKR